ncbi:hypothetical protein ILUMI_19699 [Ignelater luminosus]|uniref:PiggyBac transposable element-derived protein domain-containing protein n=1 Tax=Ignelater luminosus TaxID=2038154 RepID=A0A8K0CHP6_IGNLU|nr:hypothetical protein ILUMI_19699 [Ignelater luminosus]
MKQQIVRIYFTDSVFDKIAEVTNLYGIQKDPSRLPTITKTGIKQFIGITLYMSLVHLPNIRAYWSGDLGFHKIKNTMSVNKYEKIRRFLHFNNNETALPRDSSNYDRLHKVRPLADALNTNFSKDIPLEQYLSVDEQICSAKSRYYLKQYMPNKPHKWGFKFFVLCGVSGVELVGNYDGIDISSVVWKDNKLVTLLSTFADEEPRTVVERCDRKKKMRNIISVSCPFVIEEYNRNMGGVYFLDSNLGRVKILQRSKKWALQIVQSHSGSRTAPNLSQFNRQIAALLSSFSGDSSEDVENWMSRIEVVQTAYGVSDEIMQVIMVTKMSGAALQWYHSKIDYITMLFEFFRKGTKPMFARRPSRINLLKKRPVYTFEKALLTTSQQFA